MTGTPWTLLRSLFALEGRIDRGRYLRVGLGLAILKYLVDAAIVYAASGRLWTPWAYLSPLLILRQPLGEMSAWGLVLLGAWTLPFLWIGVNLTRKRALDAGHAPALSLLFFVPVANYVVMLYLCAATTRAAPDRPAGDAPIEPARGRVVMASLAAVLGIAAGGVVLLTSVYLLRSYGASLFAGAPFALGVVSAAIANHGRRAALRESLGIAAAALVIACGALLLLGLEGAVCIAMAFPLALPTALLGALTGHALAHGSRRAPAAAAVVTLALPGAAGIEARRPPARFEVVSATVIDAPPERVWPYVVAVSELPPPSRLLFRAGIAYPTRARLEGRGIGAVRYCEFSTGPFVEPITVWEEPTRLGFDVRSQPAPMTEWSPWRGVAPPHLDGYFRSVRGEFRLVDLGGRTRLEGSTWYELRLHPAAYWRLWADAAVGRIHARVLEHIRREVEAQTRGRAAAS